MPLIALDAIVIDTETTGLDARKARVVEIAGLRVQRGLVEDSPAFHTLIRPDEPIPADSTSIHNIDDRMVAHAPSFATAWPEIAAVCKAFPLIGHSVGFDLAVLQRECDRAGMEWSQPPALDTRLLAEIVEPTLPDYSLESLAQWLAVPAERRHSALADALTTARVFLALIPKLRHRAVHTFGEAAQACRNLPGSLERQQLAGWQESRLPSRLSAEQAFRRIDSYPFRHRVSDVMSSPAKFVAADTSLRVALERMAREKSSSLFVVTEIGQPCTASSTGIVTERDVMRALATRGADALDQPAARYAGRPLAVVRADALVYVAIGRMSRLNIRHLGVVDEQGHVIGALSARDLLKLRAGQAIALGDEVEAAQNVADLAFAWAKLPAVARSLRAEEVSGREVAAVISSHVSALTGRATQLADIRLRDQGLAAPCDYAVAILGSAARGESLLAMDQDNLLVFAEGEPGSPEDLYFAQLGREIASTLHAVGVPYCKGGIMASEPAWRGSVATWESRIEGWISRSAAKDLLSVDIFFDLRPVEGEPRLANAIRETGFSCAHGQAAFAKLLAEAAGTVESGVGFFGGFRTENGRIDLKRTGLFGIATAARVLAIRHDVRERSTAGRLAALQEMQIGARRDLEAIAEAHGTLLELILDQQIRDVEEGTPPTNRVVVAQLSPHDRERLRNALKTAGRVDAVTKDLLM